MNPQRFNSNFFPQPLDGSHYDDLIVTKEGRYSVSKPYLAEKITRCIVRHARDKGIKTDTILDGTANNGGDSINFILSGEFANVISIEKDSFEFQALQNNVQKYTNQITESKLILGDVLVEAYRKSNTSSLVYLDPPWGGPDYKDKQNLQLFLSDVSMEEIAAKLFRATNTQLLAIKIPFNFALEEFKIALEGTFSIEKEMISETVHLLIVTKVQKKTVWNRLTHAGPVRSRRYMRRAPLVAHNDFDWSRVSATRIIYRSL